MISPKNCFCSSWRDCVHCSCCDRRHSALSLYCWRWRHRNCL